MMSDHSSFQADVAPFLPKWAKPTEYERASARRASTSAEIQAFYHAAVPHMKELLQRLDEFPLGKIPAHEKPYFYLLLSLAEVAPNVEFYKSSPKIPFSFEEDRLIGGHCATPD